MSKEERLMKMGELGELRKKFAAVEDRAEGILQSIRLAAYVSPVASALDLDARKIANYAAEYTAVHAEGRKLRGAITQLEEDLGV